MFQILLCLLVLGNARCFNPVKMHKVPRIFDQLQSSVVGKTLCTVAVGLSVSLASCIALEVNIDNNPVLSSLSGLIGAIENLEKSHSKSETVQKMAELFETSGINTQLARTKYKYVSYNVLYLRVNFQHNI